MGVPLLVLSSRSQHHPFDGYLVETLLSEGYNPLHHVTGGLESVDASSLTPYHLVIISAGAARRLPPRAVEGYVRSGGQAVVIQPPDEWAPLLGLEPVGPTYAVARDAYISINTEHPWMREFPSDHIQCPGHNRVCRAEGAEALAFTAGQAAQPSVFPAVATYRLGAGQLVAFTYDLTACLVSLHQGRPMGDAAEHLDANCDGKLTPDDFFEGMRDFSLRHVPQADLHQDILVRAILGLTAECFPLPRLWHLPHAAPAAFLLDGDGDGMTWADLQWVLDAVEPHGVKFTFYLMDEQIEAFSSEDVAAVRARGHDFGPHPWTGLQPTPEQWTDEIGRIVSSFSDKFGFAPDSYRSHCVIFPGWDHAPRVAAGAGLRLDTNFVPGYRFSTGYLNGSALPVRFVGADGEVLDCYEQSTVHTEDGCRGVKCLLPPLAEDDCIALSLSLIDDLVHRFHGVYHPYFHPISLSGRGSVSCSRWFSEVLQAIDQRGLPSVSSSEWIAFNDARRALSFEDITWDPPTLDITLCSGPPVQGIALLLPPHQGQTPCVALVEGASVPLLPVPFEHLGWTALVLDIAEGATLHLTVDYSPCEA